MIKESTLEENVNIYLIKMEEKLKEDQRKINELQNKINNAARRIQKFYRRYIFYKKTIAARKIQKIWKKYMKKIKQRRSKIIKFKQFFSAYKVFYFLKFIQRKKKGTPIKLKENVMKVIGPLLKRQSWRILSNIKTKSPKFMIYLSSLQSELAYLKKYALYDRKTFTEQWQAHENKERQWMWAQIKKKWIKKDANIWINDSQKQVNAEKYINTLIQQTYLRQYERFQQSQKRIIDNSVIIKDRMAAIKHSYFISLLS